MDNIYVCKNFKWVYKYYSFYVDLIIKKEVIHD